MQKNASFICKLLQFSKGHFLNEGGACMFIYQLFGAVTRYRTHHYGLHNFSVSKSLRAAYRNSHVQTDTSNVRIFNASYMHTTTLNAINMLCCIHKTDIFILILSFRISRLQCCAFV